MGRSGLGKNAGRIAGAFSVRPQRRRSYPEFTGLRPGTRLPRPKAGTQRLDVSCDSLNLGNLPHRDGGRQSVGPNSNNAGYALLDCVRRDIAANQPVFQFRNPSSTPWQTDPINSRWQGQLGVRYSFD